MKIKYIIFGLLAGLLSFYSCTDYPIDEDGLLITVQDKCYIGSFYLYGPDNIDVLVQDSTKIDTLNQTIDCYAKFGTNIAHVKPVASLSLDSKITPDMGVWTDFTLPRKYTVISGSRRIQKEYIITVKVQGD